MLNDNGQRAPAVQLPFRKPGERSGEDWRGRYWKVDFFSASENGYAVMRSA